MEQAIALYDPQQHPRSTVSTADPRVNCLSYAAWALWYLGYPDQALKRSQEALALAEGLSHPFSLAYALGVAAVFHLLRREGQLAREQAEAVMTLSTEQGFPFWLAYGTMVRGWALAEQGQVEEGIAQMQQGLAAFRAMGTEMGRTRSSCPAGRGVWESGTGRGRADRAGRGAGDSGQNWGAFLRGRAVSAEGRADARPVQASRVQRSNSQPIAQSPTPRSPSRSRSVFSQGHRDCPQAASQVAGTAGDDEPGSAVAAAGQDRKKLTRC